MRIEGAAGRARLSRSAAGRARARPRQRRGAPRISGAVHPHLRGRVSGHRPPAGRSAAAAGGGRSVRARLAACPPGPGQAFHGRRPEAVHLPLPARRCGHVSGGRAIARRAWRGPVELSKASAPFRTFSGDQRLLRRVMTGDGRTLQADYVRLIVTETAGRISHRSSCCRCLGRIGAASACVAATAIEASLPEAIGAFIRWLLNESGWKVRKRPGSTCTVRGAARVRALSRGSSAAAMM